MLGFFVGMVGTFLCSVEKICGETPVTFNVNNTGEVERNAGLHDMFRIVYLLPNNFSYLSTFSLYIFHQVSPHCDFCGWQPSPQASAPEGKKTAGGARFWEQATKEEKIMEPSQNCLWVFSHDAPGFTHIVCPIAQQGCRYQTLPVLSKSQPMKSRYKMVTFAFSRFFSRWCTLWCTCCRRTSSSAATKRRGNKIFDAKFETFLCLCQYKFFDFFVGMQVPVARTLQVLSLPPQDGDEDKE